jgi:predicted tellurium resistance membrane protein TerC
MEYLLELAASPTAWVALATLVAMEVVLGIDNLIFISILTNKLPEQSARRRDASVSAWPWSCAWRCSAPWPGSSS